MAPPDVGGYVLAGGKSSRMGRDKALLELAGRPLVFHAVSKLRRVCKDVHILGSRPELKAFAPLVPDLHGESGPLGGIEAALEHSRHEWNLFLPVDMPFLPAAFLEDWVKEVVEKRHTRVAMFTVNGLPQPLFCLLHEDVASLVREAMGQGQHKVFPVLEAAGNELGRRQGVAPGRAFLNRPWDETTESFKAEGNGALLALIGGQRAARHLWFANLNTPEEFAEAEKHLDALDT